MTLEQRLQEVFVSFTDFLTYDEKQISYFMSIHKKKERSLYVSTWNRSYITIAENLYKGLMSESKDFWNMTKDERKLIYDVYSNSSHNADFIKKSVPL